jgi:hypothetical protein
MSTQKSDTLIPRSLLTPGYIEWSNRSHAALLAEFNDPDDPAGKLARDMVDAMWPVIESIEPEPFDDVERARERFAVALQEFVNDNVGMYKVTLKEEEKV